MNKPTDSGKKCGGLIAKGCVLILVSVGVPFFCVTRVLAELPSQKKHDAIITLRSVPSMDESTKRTRTHIYGLTWTDFDCCKKVAGVKDLVPMRIFPNQVRNEDKSFDTRIVGTSADYARLHRLEMDAGRFFNDDDNPAGKADTEVVRNVIVLGNGVAKKLFPGEECKKIVGKNVIAYRHEFEVIGVAKAADAFDQDVYIPIAIVKLRFGERITIRKPGSFTAEIVELHQIDIVADPARVQALEKEIRAILEKHHVREDWEIVPR